VEDGNVARSRAKIAGVLAVIAASVMWAIEPVVVRLIRENASLDSGLDLALNTALIRAAGMVLVAFVYVLITNKGRLKIRRADLPALVYVSIVATLLADTLYIYAVVGQLPVVNAVLIAHMQPIFIVLIGFFILKQDKLTRNDYAGIVIMIAAGLLVTTGTFSKLISLKLVTLGDMFVLFSAVLWATTAIAVRKHLTQLNAGVITFYRIALALIVFLIVVLPRSSFELSNGYQILLGGVVGVGSLLYYEGLKRLKAAQVSALELFTPFFAALLAFLFLDEGVTVMQAGGIALLFVGVYFLSRKEEAYF